MAGGVICISVCSLLTNLRPRVILVSQEGQLVGLVTVKDVLRHEVAVEHREAKSSAAPSHSRNDSLNSSNGWHDSWAGMDSGEEGTNGLEVVLEEAFAWARIRGSRVYNLIEGLLRRASGRSRESGGQEAAFEFEMAEESRDSG